MRGFEVAKALDPVSQGVRLKSTGQKDNVAIRTRFANLIDGARRAADRAGGRKKGKSRGARFARPLNHRARGEFTYRGGECEKRVRKSGERAAERKERG